MNRNYIILAALLIALAGGIFLLPERNNYKQIKPEKLMWEIVQTSRYVTTDQVAERIIEGDPTLELVDVRPADEYEAFSLPRAINIPLDSIMKADYKAYFGMEGMNVVFISNDDIKADQAWVIVKRMGYSRLYVLKGGLNCWIETIIQPKRPDETAAKEDFEQYEFRQGASMFFTGAKITVPEEAAKATIDITRRKKSTVVEGGC